MRGYLKLLCLHSFYKYPQTAIWSSNFPFYLDSRPSSFKQIANSLSFLQQLGTLHPHCIIVSKTLSFISIILLSDSLPKSNTPIGLLPLSPLLSPHSLFTLKANMDQTEPLKVTTRICLRTATREPWHWGQLLVYIAMRQVGQFLPGRYTQQSISWEE